MAKTYLATRDQLYRPNLLDNWYFKNPVNQRNMTGTITSTGYFIDRWELVRGTVQITDDGLVLNGEMRQKCEFPVGRAATAFVLTSAGTAEAVYDDTRKIFSITSAGGTVLAAKLELGADQTLAHQENGKQVLNEIPAYGEQLARCQRYFQVFEDDYSCPIYCLDFRPVMRPTARGTPVTGTLTVGDKTLYTASAEL